MSDTVLCTESVLYIRQYLVFSFRPICMEVPSYQYFCNLAIMPFIIACGTTVSLC